MKTNRLGNKYINRVYFKKKSSAWQDNGVRTTITSAKDAGDQDLHH